MTSPSDSLSQSPAAKPHTIFVGPNGIRAGWRFALFLLIFLAALAFFQTLAVVVIRPVGRLLIAVQKQQTEFTPYALMANEAISLLALIVAMFSMSRIEHRRIRDYGFATVSGDAGRRFCEGIVWGLAMILALCTILKLEGHFTFGPIVLSPATAIRYGILWAIATVLVGFFEEGFFRGYTVLTLSSGMGFWPAAFLMSALFGLSHLGDHGYTKIGVLTAALFGLLACFSLRRTGNLWLGIGYHAAFDFAETYLFSPPNGGIANISTTHLFGSTISGPAWLNGGGTGVEGSVNGLVVFAVIFLLFNWIHPARQDAARV
jgi:uncharacterized protein